MKLNSVWDDRPEDYDKLRQCWLNERRFHYVRDFIRQHPDINSVLEVGSGTGLLLSMLSREFPNIQFTGVEPLPAYVDFSRRLNLKNVEFKLGNATDVLNVCGPQKFDLVLSNDVLHHIEDWRSVFQAFSGVLRSGAKWLVIEPNPYNPYVFLNQAFKSGEHNFRAAKFKKLCQEYSWMIQKEDFIFLIPPFIKTAPVFLQKLERRLERIPCLAGGKVFLLRYQ